MTNKKRTARATMLLKRTFNLPIATAKNWQKLFLIQVL